MILGDDVAGGGTSKLPFILERSLRRFRRRVPTVLEEKSGAILVETTTGGAGILKPHIEQQVRFENSPQRHRDGGYTKGENGEAAGVVRAMSCG